MKGELTAVVRGAGVKEYLEVDTCAKSPTSQNHSLYMALHSPVLSTRTQLKKRGMKGSGGAFLTEEKKKQGGN